MASEILIPIGVNGMALTANLYTLASDTAVAAGLALTEKTNAKGWYTASNAGAQTGLHRLQILSGADTIGYYWVYLTNASPTEDVADDSVAVKPTVLGRPLAVDASGAVTASLNSGQFSTPYSGQCYLASGQASVEIPKSVYTWDWSGAPGTSGIRCGLEAQRKLRNEWSLTATSGFLTVYKEDDATVAYTQTATRTSGALPVTALGT